MVCSAGSLLTGVGASAAQKPPVTKTCSQCGAVLPSNSSACAFCESSISDTYRAVDRGEGTWLSAAKAPNKSESAWRDELALKLEGYRVRRRKPVRDVSQSELPFHETLHGPTGRDTVALADGAEGGEGFSFTVAIGRQTRRDDDRRMDIDVSVAPDNESGDNTASLAAQAEQPFGSCPVASLAERRLAALIDAVCLLFAYGGFLALFGSLGGQFMLSKLNAAVYALSFAIVYIQYFALFTIFGGTTPGMMLRHLRVVSFWGDAPTPRQLLMRTAGYLLSAGTLFLGFLWALWDEDALTWHDRVSRTYLSSAEGHAHVDSPRIA